MANGDTKTEALLNILGNGGSGDEYKGCCNTKTQQYILDAIDRINNLDPGVGGAIKVLTDDDVNYTLNGVDYIAAWLLPTGIYSLSSDATVALLVNVVDEEGTYVEGTVYDSSNASIFFITNIEEAGTIVDFTAINSAPDSIYAGISYDTGELSEVYNFIQGTFLGTNGDNDGIIGLVPAPEAADFNKFLSAQGYWKDVSGVSAVKTLTAADYNYPENNPDSLALWLLPVGQYVIDPNVRVIPALDSSTIDQSFKQGLLVLNQQADGAFYTAFILSNFSDDKYFKVQSNGNSVSGFPHDI